MEHTLKDISDGVGYEVLDMLPNDIVDMDDIDPEKQNVIIIDNYLCECENTLKKITKLFIRARHLNCSLIFLAQSFYKVNKDLRLNCTHYVIFNNPNRSENNRLCNELGIPKVIYNRAFNKQYDLLYVDKVYGKYYRNFDEEIM